MQPIVDSRIAYTTTEHTYYGCETGCCGWIAYAYDADGVKLYESEFEFMHAYDDDERQEAEDFALARFPGTRWNEEESDFHCTM